MKIIVPSGFLLSRWTRDIAAFLAACGVECAFGPESDQSILERGITLACEEFCLPLKLFCGHIASMRLSLDDRVLIPVVIGNGRGDSFPCHLQQRARDIVINLGLIEAHRVVAPRFAYDDGLRLHEGGFAELGQSLGVPASLIGETLKRRADDCLITGGVTHRAHDANREGRAIRVAITGSPPVTDDALLGGRIREILSDLGVETITPDPPNFSLADYPKDFRHFTFDAYSRAQCAWALEDPAIDGFILLQPFLCGPSSDTPRDFAKANRGKPFLPLVIDQGKSTNGIRTRIEAFLDIVSAPREKRV